MAYRESIVTPLKVCMICGTACGVQWHHCFGGIRRKKSTEYGLVVPLCEYHHTGNGGPHLNRQVDLAIKCKAQRAFENIYGHDKWMQEFGKNFL